MNHSEEISQYLPVWAPDWPRRVTRHQRWADSEPVAVRHLMESEEREGDSPFISVYGFPRGHTKDQNIPSVNTLFIDFDFDDGDYEPGSGNRKAWQRDLSHLLVRARKVARTILGGDNPAAWRASLSGHKGIHLFLDFPEVDPSAGDFDQFVGGLNDYATDLVDRLSEETGIGSLPIYVDVTSSDLGRLCRVPNTLHGGATASFDEERYCVPVTLDELAEMTPEWYEELTRSPRTDVMCSRSPSEETGEVVQQYIETSGGRSYNPTGGGSGPSIDWSRVDKYRERSNDELTLNDARFLLSDMPCVWEWIQREDKFDYGNQSHEMESHVIAKMVQSNFPFEVIKEAMSNSPRYDEEYTEQRIRELIARDFNPYSTRKLLQRAPEFMGTDECRNCQRVIENDDELQRIYT